MTASIPLRMDEAHKEAGLAGGALLCEQGYYTSICGKNQGGSADFIGSGGNWDGSEGV